MTIVIIDCYLLLFCWMLSVIDVTSGTVDTSSMIKMN